MSTCEEVSDAEQLISSCNNTISVDSKMVRLRSVVRWLMLLLMLGLLLLLPLAGRSPEQTYGFLGNSTMLAQENGFDARTVEVAECILNVNLASSSLAYAGATISHASRHCSKEVTESGAKPPEECSMATTEIFSVFAAIASFISSGISQCPVLRTNEMAECSASVAKLLSSLAEVGIDGKLISVACTESSHEPHSRLTDEGGEDLPNLEPAAETETPAVERFEVAGHVAEGSEEAHEIQHAANKHDQAVGLAECSVKAASAVFFLGKAASDIFHATRHCPKGEEDHEGGSDLACSVAVENSIGALGTVANTLATVAMDCASSVNIKTRCAVDVTKLITALVEVAASATGTHVNCVAKPHKEREHSREVEHRHSRNWFWGWISHR